MSTTYRRQTDHTLPAKFLQTEESFLEDALLTAFGEVLTQLRMNAAVSQEQLGFTSNLGRQYISSLELGRKVPSLPTLFKLAAALNISPDQFVRLVLERLNTNERRI